MSNDMEGTDELGGGGCQWTGGRDILAQAECHDHISFSGECTWRCVRLAAEQRQGRGNRVACVGAGVAAPPSLCIGRS